MSTTDTRERITASAGASRNIYREFRAQGMPVTGALARARYVTGVREWEREHVSFDLTPQIDLDGHTYTVKIEHDPNETPEEFDCYTPEDIAAWSAGEWEFVYVTVEVEVSAPSGERVTGSASMGGIEAGPYWRHSSGLDQYQQVWVAILEYDMLTEALEDARGRTER